MTGILKHRGISLAIALLAALALALSTMSPLVPTVRKAYAAQGAICASGPLPGGSVFGNSAGTKAITAVTSGSTTSVSVYVDDLDDTPGKTYPITVRVNAGLINGASEASATAAPVTDACFTTGLGTNNSGKTTDDGVIGRPDGRARFTYVAPTLSGTTTSQLVQVSVDADFDGIFGNEGMDVIATLLIVQGSASGSITPTGSLNIPADRGSVVLTATFHDANDKTILASNAVTVTTTLGTLTAREVGARAPEVPGVGDEGPTPGRLEGQDRGGTPGNCDALQVCAAGTTSNTGTYRVILTGGGVGGTATVTFTLGTITVTKTVTLSGTTSTITVSTSFDQDLGGPGSAYVAGSHPNAATIAVTADGGKGARVNATLKDASGFAVAGVTPTISSTTADATFGACSKSLASGSSKCAITGLPAAGTVVDYKVKTGAASGSGTFTVGGKFSSTSSTIEVVAADIAPVSAGSITVMVADSSGNLIGDGTSVTLIITAGALLASTARTVDGVATFTYVSPATAQMVNVTALVGTKSASATFNVGGAVAGTVTVTPNSPYTSGLNSIVVQGSGSPADVVAVVATASSMAVTVIWVYSTGEWVFFLPATPSIAGGLAIFPGPVASAFVVLG